jgi:hypothetical protein
MLTECFCQCFWMHKGAIVVVLLGMLKVIRHLARLAVGGCVVGRQLAKKKRQEKETAQVQKLQQVRGAAQA